MTERTVLKCPCCGASTRPTANRCDSCNTHFVPENPTQLQGLAADKLHKVLTHLAELAPNESRLNLARGLCLLGLRNYDRARDQFSELITHDPTNPCHHALYALCMIAGKHPRTLTLANAKLVAQHAQTARELESHHPEATLVLATLVREYFELGGVRYRGPSADELCSDLASCADRSRLASIRQHLTISDKKLLLLIGNLI